jgi:endonuclease V-like protein UPF0215 family
VKPGARALGVAESYRENHSTLAGTVVRADRVVDGFVFGSCTVGGSDATDAVCALVTRLDRDDVQSLLVAGVAPAWYNVLDLWEIHERTGLPVLSVSFEESDGLAEAIRSAFDGTARQRRLARYRAQPDRQPVAVGESTVYVRSVGSVDAPATVRAFTPEGGRPEPVRVARQAARAADSFRRECELL